MSLHDADPPPTDGLPDAATAPGEAAPETPDDADLRLGLREAAVRRIRFLMDFYKIDPRELVESSHAPPAEQVAAAPLPPKYRHPVSGETWDGVGRQPPWLRDALLREGCTVYELRVDLERPTDADSA